MPAKPIIRDNPQLVRGGFSDEVYIVTRWRDHGEGRMEAVEKYPITFGLIDFVLSIDEETGRALADKLGYDVLAKE